MTMVLADVVLCRSLSGDAVFMRTIVFCPSFERGILFMYLLSISVVRLTGLRGEQGRVQFGVDNPGFTFPGFSSPVPLE